MEQKIVTFEEVAAHRLGQVADELKSYENWPRLEVDGVKLLYAVALALGLSRRAIAALLDQRSLNHLLALGAIDQPELTALSRTLASRPATRWDEGGNF